MIIFSENPIDALIMDEDSIRTTSTFTIVGKAVEYTLHEMWDDTYRVRLPDGQYAPYSIRAIRMLFEQGTWIRTSEEE